MNLIVEEVRKKNSVTQLFEFLKVKHCGATYYFYFYVFNIIICSWCSLFYFITVKMNGGPGLKAIHHIIHPFGGQNHLRHRCGKLVAGCRLSKKRPILIYFISFDSILLHFYFLNTRCRCTEFSSGGGKGSEEEESSL